MLLKDKEPTKLKLVLKYRVVVENLENKKELEMQDKDQLDRHNEKVEELYLAQQLKETIRLS